jgi:hypothetical protein
MISPIVIILASDAKPDVPSMELAGIYQNGWRFNDSVNNLRSIAK